ncbi:MAG: hypothetical protein AAF558_14000, partial [Verrucomicrobiota bacterium]
HALPTAGYISVSVPSGSLTTFTTTLENISSETGDISAGVVDSSSSNTITDSGANWTVDFHDSASLPQFLKLTSGLGEGTVFQITDSTATTLTVLVPSGFDISSLISPGSTTYVIINGETLDSLFESVSVLTGTDSVNADRVFLFNSSWSQYYKNTSDVWQREDPFGDVDATGTVIKPGQGFIYAAQSGSSPTITTSGIVSTNDYSTIIVNGIGSNSFVSVGHPVDQTIESLGLESVLSGANGEANQALADKLFIYLSGSWRQFYYDTSSSLWTQDDPFGDFDATGTLIPSNTPILISKVGGSGTSVATVSNPIQ